VDTIVAMALHWQEPEIQLLTALLPCVSVNSFVDIGAERGAFVDAMLEAGCEVLHAFEPEPANAAALRARFDGTTVVVHECAVSDADGTLVLHTSVAPDGDPLPYGHTVLRRPDTDEIAWNGAISVPARSVGSLAEGGELPARAGLLKVDTEGHDLAVVNGLGAFECDVVMVEHWAELPNSLGRCPWTSEQMTSALTPRGFSQFVLVDHRGEAALVKWNDAEIGAGRFGNLVFLHDRVADAAWPAVAGCATAWAEDAVVRLEARLREVEADRAARLEVIQRLDAQLRAMR
jgi:FkbM family methyltransferase